jgi:hypothetical protein
MPPWEPARSLPRCRYVLVEELRQLKHGDLVAPQHLLEGRIRLNLASILGILQRVLFGGVSNVDIDGNNA